MNSAFNLLKSKAKNDLDWEVFNYALGNEEEKREINVSENSFSSSILNILPAHLKAEPRSRYIGKEVINIKTLDSLFIGLVKTAKNIYLKIDAQGFERKIIEGAENSLAHVDTVQMEMSLTPLYEGELLFNEMCLLMSKKGYTLVTINNGFSDSVSGQLMQVDGIFHRL